MREINNFLMITSDLKAQLREYAYQAQRHNQHRLNYVTKIERDLAVTTKPLCRGK